MRSLHIGKQITIRNDQSLDKYLNEINKIPLISIEREVQLTTQIKAGDQQAFQELVSANLRFVVSVAKQYQNQGLSLSDLINEGNIGLVKAASRFDETRGFKFISYAVWWIRQAIIQALTVTSKIVRLPLNKINVLSKIKKATVHFEQLHSRYPSTDEICGLINSTKEEVELCLINSGRDVSIDAPLNDEKGASRLDLMKSEGFPTPETALITDSLKIDLDAVLNSLPDREAEIIRLYYGIGMDAPMALSDIGQFLGITRERVRQIRESAIRNVKFSGRADILIKYLG
ncbi:MAG: RNA polymerase sigma factor RpoD/SigA [Algicola sp.]|nr:RNA polymerase sigma factor RpoD/SigA [Algicola sp.]